MVRCGVIWLLGQVDECHRLAGLLRDPLNPPAVLGHQVRGQRLIGGRPPREAVGTLGVVAPGMLPEHEVRSAVGAIDAAISPLDLESRLSLSTFRRSARGQWSRIRTWRRDLGRAFGNGAEGVSSWRCAVITLRRCGPMPAGRRPRRRDGGSAQVALSRHRGPLSRRQAEWSSTSMDVS